MVLYNYHYTIQYSREQYKTLLELCGNADRVEYINLLPTLRVFVYQLKKGQRSLLIRFFTSDKVILSRAVVCVVRAMRVYTYGTMRMSKASGVIE